MSVFRSLLNTPGAQPPAPTPTSILPDAYQGVEHIISSGTQYINTGVNATSELKIDIDVFIVRRDECAILYGGGNGWQNKYIQAEFDSIAYYAYNNSTYQTYLTLTPNTVCNILQDKNNFTIHIGSSYQSKTFTYGAFTTEYPITLFAGNRGGNVVENGTYGIERCKIYDNDVLVRDFIPCYRKSDDVIGMYDVVNDVFYTNQGTGTFTKGANKTFDE